MSKHHSISQSPEQIHFNFDEFANEKSEDEKKAAAETPAEKLERLKASGKANIIEGLLVEDDQSEPWKRPRE